MIGFTLTGSDYRNLNKLVLSQLYDYIKEKKFKEYIGEYQEKTPEDSPVSSVNKPTYRVITYVEI